MGNKCNIIIVRLIVMIAFIVSLFAFEVSAEGITNTWNTVNEPGGPEGGSGDLIIVKFYNYYDRVTNTYVPMRYSVRRDCSRNIELQHETDYEISDWCTNTLELVPDGDSTIERYVEYKAVSQGGFNKDTNNGLKEGSLNVDNSYKVLYINLNTKYEGIDVVRVYDGSEGTIVEPQGGVMIVGTQLDGASPKGGYIFDESKITKDDKKEINSWSESEGTIGKEQLINVAKDIETVYIHYIENDSEHIVLNQNELSHTYTLADVNSPLMEMWETFPNKYSSGEGRHGRGKDKYTCSWETELSDASYHIEVVNHFNYSNTTNIGANGKFSGVEIGKVFTDGNEVPADISGFETLHLVPNWKFVLYRDKEIDKVTLYKGKNTQETIEDLRLIGIDKQGYKPNNTRISQTGQGRFEGGFKTLYDLTNIKDMLSYMSTCSKHGPNGTYRGTRNIGVNNINGAYSSDNNTLTKYYLGDINKGVAIPNTDIAPFKVNNRIIKGNLSVKLEEEKRNFEFYPAVKMNYEDINNTLYDAYVVSENLSEVLNLSRIEIGTYRSSAKPIIDLDSTQWSTHMRSQNFLDESGIDDKNSVLPGGAIYSLKTSNTSSNASELWVGMKIYQTVIDESEKDKFNSLDSIRTVDEARNDINSYLLNVENTLEHYQVVQWISKGVQTEQKEFEKDKVLISGVGAKNIFEDSKLQREDKYYLKVDGDDASRADIDIVNKEVGEIIWDISSDVNGNVTLKKDGVEIAKINKTEDFNKMLITDEIIALNNKTKIVENFINAIDRNGGTDKSFQTWYNEEFSSIKVIETSVAYQLGFGGKQTERSSALDTKLCGKADSKIDVYNYKDADRLRTSMFKLSSRSTVNSDGKAPGYIGTYNNMDIIIPNIENVITSKLFYIPNATVKDLN